MIYIQNLTVGLKVPLLRNRETQDSNLRQETDDSDMIFVFAVGTLSHENFFHVLYNWCAIMAIISDGSL
jgi:hypothetical protein